MYHQPEWADPTRWIKAETCFEELRDRSYKIWHFDADDMVRQTVAEYSKRLGEASRCEVQGYAAGTGSQSSKFADLNSKARKTAVAVIAVDGQTLVVA